MFSELKVLEQICSTWMLSSNCLSSTLTGSVNFFIPHLCILQSGKAIRGYCWWSLLYLVTQHWVCHSPMFVDPTQHGNPFYSGLNKVPNRWTHLTVYPPTFRVTDKFMIFIYSRFCFEIYISLKNMTNIAMWLQIHNACKTDMYWWNPIQYTNLNILHW